MLGTFLKVSEPKYKACVWVQGCLTLKCMLFPHIFIHLSVYSYSGFGGVGSYMHWGYTDQGMQGGEIIAW